MAKLSDEQRQVRMEAKYISAAFYLLHQFVTAAPLRPHIDHIAAAQSLLGTVRVEGIFGPCPRCAGSGGDPDGKSICRLCCGQKGAMWDEEQI